MASSCASTRCVYSTVRAVGRPDGHVSKLVKAVTLKRKGGKILQEMPRKKDATTICGGEFVCLYDGEA